MEESHLRCVLEFLANNFQNNGDYNFVGNLEVTLKIFKRKFFNLKLVYCTIRAVKTSIVLSH